MMIVVTRKEKKEQGSSFSRNGLIAPPKKGVEG